MFQLVVSQMSRYPVHDIRPRAGNRLWLPGALALTFCALLLANWLSPVGFRLKERFMDAPVLFGTLSLLSAYAFMRGRQIRTTWRRLLMRALGALVFVLVVLVGCTTFVFRVDALPVADISVGYDRVVAYWMVGGAMGPHYTEFREERSVVPGLLLARVVGYSPYIGDVTLSLNFGNTLQAVVAEDTERGSLHPFECRVAPLLPW